MVLMTILHKFKDFVVWSWTYLWAAWCLLVVFLLYYLRGPLRISENVAMATMFLSTLTPKFYVALTGTSSLISGLILIFEWWYYRRYGMSFIEQVSLNHISPWFGGVDGSENTNGAIGNGSAGGGGGGSSGGG